MPISVGSDSGFHTAGYIVRAGSMRNLSDETRHKLDEISPVMQGFVIDRAAACRVGSSLNAKDRGLLLDFQRCSDLNPGWHSVQLVLGLDQRNIIFALKK